MESAKWYIGRMHARERAQKTAERRALTQATSTTSSAYSTAAPSPTSTWSTSYESPSPTSTKNDQLAALSLLQVPKWSPGDLATPLSPPSPCSLSSEEAADDHDRAAGRQFTALELLGRVAAMG